MAPPPLLEYWKPPKAVQHLRLRSEGSVVLLNSLVKSTNSEMAFRQMDHTRSGSLKETGGEVHMIGPPPAYKVSENAESKDPHWLDIRYWSKKRIALCVLGFLVLIGVVVAVVVVEVRKNRYPDYSQLSYSKAEQCMLMSVHVSMTQTNISKSLALHSSIISITSPAMILQLVSFIISLQNSQLNL
jgi:hypothetical protein